MSDIDIDIAPDAAACGRRAAAEGARILRERLADGRRHAAVFATGASQLDMLDALTAAEGIAWDRLVGFHLDEYIGLAADHPASFVGYLKRRLVEKVPFADFRFLDGAADPVAECRRVGALLTQAPTVAFVGIGENGHLAFNDPPADFDATEPYLVVELDEACRRQQLGEGWFGTLADVPTRAMSMSCRQILRAETIVCTVPDSRKADAVRAALRGPVTPDVPASILQTHGDCRLFLDEASAAGLGT